MAQNHYIMAYLITESRRIQTMRTMPLHAHPFTPSHRCSSSVLASDSDSLVFISRQLSPSFGVRCMKGQRSPNSTHQYNLFLFLLPNPLPLTISSRSTDDLTTSSSRFSHSRYQPLATGLETTTV